MASTEQLSGVDVALCKLRQLEAAVHLRLASPVVGPRRAAPGPSPKLGPMVVRGIESSCDETGVAVVESGDTGLPARAYDK